MSAEGAVKPGEWTITLLGTRGVSRAPGLWPSFTRLRKWRPPPVKWSLALRCALFCVCLFALAVTIAVVIILLEVDNSPAGFPSPPPPPPPLPLLPPPTSPSPLPPPPSAPLPPLAP